MDWMIAKIKEIFGRFQLIWDAITFFMKQMESNI